jgi:hypothetical protein
VRQIISYNLIDNKQQNFQQQLLVSSVRGHTFKNVECEITVFIAGNYVLCCFNSEFTKKINKITYKTDKNTNIFVILLVFCDFIDFVCEFTVKTTGHRVACY